MPSNEEVAESIQRVKNHTNKITKLEVDTTLSLDKGTNIEGIISLLQKCYNDISGSVDKLSGSVEELSRLVKVGGVK